MNLTTTRIDEPSTAAFRGRPASAAAVRASRANLAVGTLGLASVAFVVVQLGEAWRLAPASSAHHLTVLGQRLGYPTANLQAVVVLVLALIGFVVVAGATAAAAGEAAAAVRLGRRLSGARPGPFDDVLVIDDDDPHAFCAGLWHPKVYVSAGAVAQLDPPALGAVIAHERHHAARRDPLRLAATRVLARALFFLPWLSTLSSRQAALTELSADEEAIGNAEANRTALARAMLHFSDSAAPGVGIDPARVDQLTGAPVSWAFPVGLCACAVAVTALLAGVAALLGRSASGSLSLALPLVSHQPCVVALALLPAAISFVAIGVWRGDRRARRT